MDNPKVSLRTELGELVLEVYAAQTPLTAANFLRYVDQGRYTGASFYRAVRPDNQPQSPVKIEVIQGGLGMGEHPAKLPPIAHETTAQTGLRHLDGTISMSRLEPDSASSEFFICIGDQPELDFGGKRNPDGQGFAAFGKVLSGMDVVRAIQVRPSGGDTPPVQGQWLLEPVAILEVRRVSPTFGQTTPRLG
ncbi:MAG: peptidylprolyl isomerase [Thermaceae bacterium]|nr:peptidylprolyl isomerase [Thermaceae bacterium]